MKPEMAQVAFQEFLAQRSWQLPELTLAKGMEAMVHFYRTQPAESCSFEDDADMLLFQWGINDSDKEETYYFNITRQLIFGDHPDEDENFWQLALTLRFALTNTLYEIGEGNKWCPNVKALDYYYETFLRSLPAFKILADESPLTIELDYSNVG